jgi:MarR family 2-MHQ and catechol resistance regulon transcriptional repressor
MFGVTDAGVEQAVRSYVKLMRAYRAVTGRVEALLATHGLTLTQIGVLEVVLHKGSMTHRELGRKVLTSAGNMTDVVDKLEARGLVRRVRAEADRRQVRVELTGAGRAMIEALFPRHAEDIARAMAGLPRDELRQLGELLRRLGIAAAREDAEPDLAVLEEDPHLTA